MSTKPILASTCDETTGETAMSTKRPRASSSDGTTTAEAAAPSLPVDVMLEIVARSDLVAIVRWAAISKPLRLAILDQDLRRRLALLAAPNGGFDKRFLLGVSYLHDDVPTIDGRGAVLEVHNTPASLPRPLVRLNAGIMEQLHPVVSRDGVLLLQRQVTRDLHCGHSYYCGHTYYCNTSKGLNLYICNTFTGQVTGPLPRIAVHGYIYQPALLTAGDAGRSFELLIAARSRDDKLQTQTFSSQDGKWSAVRQADHLHPPGGKPLYDSLPAVVGRTAHWLSVVGNYPLTDDGDLAILALHADTARAKTIELPRRCVSRMNGCRKYNGELLLGASADGRLRLVVALREVIAMWTLSSPESQQVPARWSRQVVISRVEIDKQLPAWPWAACGCIQFNGFGGSSGIVLMQMEYVGLVQLDLATNEATVLRRSALPGALTRSNISQACLHEISVASLLEAMKPF